MNETRLLPRDLFWLELLLRYFACVCVGGWTKLIKLKLFSFLDNFLKDISGFVGDEDQAKASCLAGCVLSF